MSKSWLAYAQHILDVSAKIGRIQARGDLTQDEVLYDAALRNFLAFLGVKSAVFATFWFTTTWVTSTQ